MTEDGVLIVGGSVAGTRVARALRRLDYRGRIRIVEAEPHLPYDKPPLSKTSLKTDADPLVPLLTREEAISMDVELLLGVAATALDPHHRLVTLADGTTLCFDDVVIATGASARRPPWGEVAGVHLLRSLDDAVGLRAQLDRSQSLLVIGAGFIGSEIASAARERGLSVTMVDPLPIPMARIVGPSLGLRFAELHRARGVDVRFGSGISELVATAGGVRATLTDGEVVEASSAVVGIGVQLNLAWLERSGLVLDDGIVADQFCRAVGHPHVHVAGDIARWWHPRHRRLARVEHWTNAIEQADLLAHNIVHAEQPETYQPVEYVWSDQYDWKIQIVGVPTPDIEPVVLEQSQPFRLAALWSDPDGSLVGGLTVNWPKVSVACRRGLLAGVSTACVLDGLVTATPVAR